MSNDKLARSVALEQTYVHDVYEQFCDNPASRPWPRVQEFIENLEPGSVVCDVGCGSGKYLDVGSSVFSIGGEKSKRLSETARENENEVILLDNLALPFRDESMDAVLSIAVIHHFATTERRVCALRELARVLRIGGRLIISVWAMEQSQRKFESQDVLVPCHRPHLSTPSLDVTPTTVLKNDSSDDECHLQHHHRSGFSGKGMEREGMNKTNRTKRRTKPPRPPPASSEQRNINSSPSSSSLSSPNETCYSFVRRAIQKLAGGRRVSGSSSGGINRPWFLETWANCAKDPPATKRYDPDGCECCQCASVDGTTNTLDLPIELRRVDFDDEVPPQQRRQTFPSSQLISDVQSVKSRSMNNMSVENEQKVTQNITTDAVTVTNERSISSKPKLVKQKKSICDDDADEILAAPRKCRAGAVFKQQSLNEELMSTERLQEKERLRSKIHKQTSLNEDLIFNRQRHYYTFDNIFSTKRLQLIKTGFANKIKNSNIEKVTGSSLKNGFVRMFQWSSDLVSPTIPEDEIATTPKTPKSDCSNGNAGFVSSERRHSREEGSDSSKDSSLQSDTSVDSEDSFASVIFVPKSNPMSPTLSPGPTSPRLNSSVPNSPRIKQSSCPTSPRIKQMPLSIYPLTKQLSSPKPSSVAKIEPPTTTSVTGTSSTNNSPAVNKTKKPIKTTVTSTSSTTDFAAKYQVVPIPKFRETLSNTPKTTEKEKPAPLHIEPEKVQTQTKEKRSKDYPIVRRTSVNNGKVEAIVKPLPKLLQLELFNPETDDKDSDSSCVSSPDSVDSVISVNVKRKFTFPDIREDKVSLLQAAADVAQSLDMTVFKAIESSPGGKRREIKTVEMKSVLERQYSESTGVAEEWNEECHKHLTDFADQLSEKLMKEIDQYQEKCRQRDLAGSTSSLEHIDDPYIHRLSEELHDLSQLNAEIQKQNEYLAKLSTSDKVKFSCGKCKQLICKCKSSNSSKTANKKINKCQEEEIKKPLLTSVESIDSERGISGSNTPLQRCGRSTDSATDSRSDCGGSTASLASCPEWKTIRTKPLEPEQPPPRSVSELTSSSKDSKGNFLAPSLSDTSQESLPSDVGGEITYHRYYHVFREGELDQLIEKYVENLHIISSYYDHASWCVVAEKVQVWTI